jgi:hypothetical protein
MISSTSMSYVAPLCPAGHLPLRGRDQKSSPPSAIASIAGGAARVKLSISPLEEEMPGRAEGSAKERNGSDDEVRRIVQ